MHDVSSMVEKVAKNGDIVICTQFSFNLTFAEKTTSVSGESEMFPIVRSGESRKHAIVNYRINVR